MNDRTYKTDCCGANLKYEETERMESIGAYGNAVGHVSYYCRGECPTGKGE